MKAKIIALVVALTATITGVAAPNGYYNHDRINVNSSVILTINKKPFKGVVVINNRRTDWDSCYTYEYYRPRYVTVSTRVIAYDRCGRPYVRTVYRRVLVR